MLAGIKQGLEGPALLAEVERRVQAVTKQHKPKEEHGKRVAQLQREIGHLADAAAGGLLKASPALAQRLQAAEVELARLAAVQHTDVPPTIVIPNVRKRFLGMRDRLDSVLMRDAEGREELRGILAEGEKIKLLPDKSGRFLWADYALGLAALLPPDANAEIMVAGARSRTMVCPRYPSAGGVLKHARSYQVRN